MPDDCIKCYREPPARGGGDLCRFCYAQSTKNLKPRAIALLVLAYDKSVQTSCTTASVTLARSDEPVARGLATRKLIRLHTPTAGPTFARQRRIPGSPCTFFNTAAGNAFVANLSEYELQRARRAPPPASSASEVFALARVLANEVLRGTATDSRARALLEAIREVE